MIQAKINHRTSSGSLLILASRAWITTCGGARPQVKAAPCTVATDLIGRDAKSDAWDHCISFIFETIQS